MVYHPRSYQSWFTILQAITESVIVYHPTSYHCISHGLPSYKLSLYQSWFTICISHSLPSYKLSLYQSQFTILQAITVSQFTILQAITVSIMGYHPTSYRCVSRSLPSYKLSLYQSQFTILEALNQRTVLSILASPICSVMTGHSDLSYHPVVSMPNSELSVWQPTILQSLYPNSELYHLLVCLFLTPKRHNKQEG